MILFLTSVVISRPMIALTSSSSDSSQSSDFYPAAAAVAAAGGNDVDTYYYNYNYSPRFGAVLARRPHQASGGGDGYDGDAAFRAAAAYQQRRDWRKLVCGGLDGSVSHWIRNACGGFVTVRDRKVFAQQEGIAEHSAEGTTESEYRCMYVS